MQIKWLLFEIIVRNLNVCFRMVRTTRKGSTYSTTRDISYITRPCVFWITSQCYYVRYNRGYKFNQSRDHSHLGPLGQEHEGYEMSVIFRGRGCKSCRTVTLKDRNHLDFNAWRDESELCDQLLVESTQTWLIVMRNCRVGEIIVWADFCREFEIRSDTTLDNI